MTLSTSAVKSWLQSSHEYSWCFHVVLVDLKKAANGEIHCVKKPLEDTDLKYVALSYRCGELEEAVIDTKVGYTAVIKSFHLDDFYQLCRMITKEIDLKHMDYVWVDAICVDQTNYEQRKATIYHMSNIYEHAKYILAVPDLHARYLRTISTMNKSAMEDSAKYKTDIYHLLHANWTFHDYHIFTLLNKWNVPDDSDLRKVLETYTNASIDDFNTQQIFEKNVCKFFDNQLDNDNQTEDRTLSAQNRMQDQIDGDDVSTKGQYLGHKWKTSIQERKKGIQQSMEFLEDLIKDWSTRVWVISEFHIAKEKKNLKYWFTQLAPDMKNFDDLDCGAIGFSFFKFVSVKSLHKAFTLPNGTLYTDLTFKFFTTMDNQLQEQSLFEMLLKSKASRHEDRLYAILPLKFYKDAIRNEDMGKSWKIDSFISVKLKLYELMETFDMLNLLFFSGNPQSTLSGILPSFATSTLKWGACEKYFDIYHSNDILGFDRTKSFNMENNYLRDPIGIRQSKTLGLICLYFCPIEYYVDEKFVPSKDDVAIIFEKNRALGALHSKDPFDVNALVCIPNVHYYHEHIEDMEKHSNLKEMPPITDKIGFIYLIGNFEKNKWVLTDCPDVSKNHHWNLRSIDEDDELFNIY